MSPHQTAWQLLSRDLSASTARYALVDCAAASDFSDDDEIHTRLSRPGVEKLSLFYGRNVSAIDPVAPCLVPLDNQKQLRAWLLENCRGRNWAIFFVSEAPVKTLLAHFQRLFDIQAENGRRIFFRLYDPQILRQFMPLLDRPEARAFFGPVIRFVAEDDQGRPLVFDRPQAPGHGDLDPVKVIVSKRAFFSRNWNRHLMQQHVETYRRLGREAAADPDADALTLTDGVIGADMGLATFGAGGFAAKRLSKAASALRPNQPKGRIATLMARVRGKAHNPNARVKSTAAKQNGRSRQFCVSDPVDPVTGQVVLDQDDFTLAGRVPLAWSRHYGSQSDFDGLLGPGWQCPTDARLTVDADGFVTFYDGTPKAAVFEALPEDQPVMEAADGALLENGQDGFRVRLKSGLAYHFGPSSTDAGSPVLQISDPDGHCLRFERQDGRLVRICDDSGQILEVTCDQNRITAITHHDRPLVRYHYQDGLLACAMDALGHAERFEYQNGRLVRHMDRNKVSFHYGYDTAGRCTHVWDDDGMYDYYLEYQPLNRRTRATDSRGRVQTFVYDADHLPVQVIDYDGAVTAYAYDDVGRTIQVTDPLGRSTCYDYDDAGNLIEVIRPDNHRLVVIYDDNHRPIQVQDPNGGIWEQRFDAKGRPIERIDPLDGRTIYAYNAAGDLESLRDAEGHVTRFEWDTRGLLSAVTDPAGSATHYQRDPWGGVTAVVDAAGAAARYVYDEKGRLLQTQKPSGAGRSYAWDPEDNLIAQTDELGHQTRFEYGGFNQLTKRINADGSFVTYHYDSEENLVGVSNERGQTYRFDYDTAGRVTRRIDYWGHSTYYAYDAAGQLVQSRDPLDRVVTYAYDPAGCLWSKTFENNEHEVFNWDAVGNLTGFNGPGGDVQRFFDAAGNLIGEQGNGFNIEYQYDANGRCVQRTTSNGNQVQYGYDPLGAVSHITINDQPPVAIARDPLGRIVREQFSKYLQRTFDYDENGNLTGQRIMGDAGRILRGYTYDAAGRLIEKSDSHKGPWKLDYDPLGRITQYRDPEQRIRQFPFDPAGDLLEHLPDTGQSLRIAHLNAIEHKYDPAGNLVQRRQGVALSRLDWDAQNRLTCVRTPDDRTIRMTYDALGRRRVKAVNGERTFFAWDGDALLCERFEDQPAREYVYYPGTFEPLAVIEGDGQVYYYHNDVNGLPQELTRPNGDIVWSATYDALGRVEKLLVNEVIQPLRLQGQYFDEETRLCYNRFRYFDPATYAFISQDPIGLAGGENVYAYAPNVWIWVDPLGLSCKDASRKGTATVYWHDNRGPGNAFGHYSVEVSTGGNTVHTHQIGAPGTDTMISTDLSGVVPPTKSHTFKLPDAKSAQDFQLRNLNKSGPPYDTKNRSCVTHVGRF